MITRIKVDVIAPNQSAIDAYAQKLGFELFFDAPDDENYLLSEFGYLAQVPAVGFLIGGRKKTTGWLCFGESLPDQDL